ncbi:MAG: NUDIX domain-containing protein [Patescibacteria group bacterium]|jgi:8-oxo-dGTP diphosphatase|nr:NUDIX domain-containing protein [Patescibacteria group bacterium]
MQKGIDYPGISICYFCHDGEGNFVMMKRGKNCRDENDTWDTGGGALEFGDDVIKTLKKEIKEEFCADVKEYEFLGYRDVHRKNKEQKTHWLALDFKVLIDKNQIKNGEPHKFDEIQWFTFENLPENLHSMLPKFFEKYKEKLQ